jgi:hypothetical protein
MVDKDHVRQQLLNHFNLTGPLDIDDHGLVSVRGDVMLVKNVSELPVRFSTVTGNFSCAKRGLTSLEGAPREVGKTFDCKQNQLSTLVGGPDKVDVYNAVLNPLTNLDGLASEIRDHVQFSYDENLPLLRTLVAPKIWPHPDQVELERILHKYAGQGKPGTIKCCVELIKAGFKGNAKW